MEAPRRRRRVSSICREDDIDIRPLTPPQAAGITLLIKLTDDKKKISD
jgi:hypothetical protein